MREQAAVRIDSKIRYTVGSPIEAIDLQGTPRVWQVLVCRRLASASFNESLTCRKILFFSGSARLADAFINDTRCRAGGIK